MKHYLHLTPLLLVVSIAAFLPAQQNHHSLQSDNTQTIQDVRSLVIASNNIRSIIYNTGAISGPGVIANIHDLVWKGLGYGYEFGFLAGAKVPSAFAPGDSIRFIVDGFGANNRSTVDGDFSPDALTKWGWLPTSHYRAPGTQDIANNQDPATWPSSWTGWKGKFGAPIADLEVLYEMNDASDAEFPYYPFPSDSATRGLGLTVDARVYQFSQENLSDVLFTFYEIRNTSPKPLTHMAAGFFGDPHIGGAFDYSDDTQDFHPGTSMLYSWDKDRIGSIPGLTPGYFGARFVESPGHLGMTSSTALPYGGNNRPKNDGLLYDKLTRGIDTAAAFYSKDSNAIGDFVIIGGTGTFTLLPGDTAELGIAYLFADALPALIERASITDREYRIRFAAPGPPITILSPLPGDKFQTSSVMIQWNMTGMDGDTTIDLYYSNTAGEEWKPIALRAENNGTYQWNISGLPDGIFYKVHLVRSSGGSVSYAGSNGYFTLNGPGAAPPQVQLLAPKNVKQLKNAVTLQWLAGDADGDAVTIRLHTSQDDGFTYHPVADLVNNGSTVLDTRLLPNSRGFRIKLEAFSSSISAEVTSPSFFLNNDYHGITDTASLKHIAGRGTGAVIPGIADSGALNGHTYRITFDSTGSELRYTLRDITLSATRLSSEPMTTLNGTGQLVDGMRIWFNNHPTAPDSNRSGFGTVQPNARRVVWNFFNTLPRRSLPVDHQFQFGSMDTLASGMYAVPMDSFRATSGSSFVKTPFSIVNITDTTQVQVRINEKISQPGKFRRPGRWDQDEEILFIYPGTNNTIHANVSFTKSESGSPFSVASGAVFTLRTTKSFTPADTFQFIADPLHGLPTPVRMQESAPVTFALEQNYPNPFNPETRIRFSVPLRMNTRITIYDAVGREVDVLLDEMTEPGRYEVTWEGKDRAGRSVATGVYFCRMTSGAFVQTTKMLLMR